MLKYFLNKDFILGLSCCKEEMYGTRFVIYKGKKVVLERCDYSKITLAIDNKDISFNKEMIYRGIDKEGKKYVITSKNNSSFIVWRDCERVFYQLDNKGLFFQCTDKHKAFLNYYSRCKREIAKYKLYNCLENKENRNKMFLVIYNKFEPTLKNLQTFLPKEYFEYLIDKESFDIKKSKEIVEYILKRDFLKKEPVIIEKIDKNREKYDFIYDKIDDFVLTYCKEKNIIYDDIMIEKINDFIFEYDFFSNIDEIEDLNKLSIVKSEGYKILDEIIRTIKRNDTSLKKQIELCSNTKINIYSKEDFIKQYEELYYNFEIWRLDNNLNTIIKRIEKLLLFETQIETLRKQYE